MAGVGLERLRAADVDEERPARASGCSNGCCEVSARDAVMLNYKVVMISDASATYTDDMHGNCLQFFYLVYGDVLTVDEGIAGLAATAPARLRSA